MPDTMEQFRDIVRSDAVFHIALAKRLDRWAQYADRMNFSAMARELASDARACRSRAGLLNDVLGASQPKMEEVEQ